MIRPIVGVSCDGLSQEKTVEGMRGLGLVHLEFHFKKTWSYVYIYYIYINMYSMFSQLDPCFSEVFFKRRWLIVKTYSTWCGSQSRELEFCSFSVYMGILKSYRIFHCMLMLYDPQFKSIVSNKGPQARCNFIFCQSPWRNPDSKVQCKMLERWLPNISR